MSTQTRPITADDFFDWPQDPGSRQELIRGEVVTMSLAGGEHGDVALQIGFLVKLYLQDHHRGRAFAAETGFILERDPDTVRGADVAYVSNERLATITNRRKLLPVSPDLVVEVRSPNDRDPEIEEKTELWLAAGSRLVWNVDPGARTVTVHRPGARFLLLTETDEIDGADVLPGFRCRVADFFA